MLKKMFNWIKTRFVSNKKIKNAFDNDNHFLIL
jgi:hypothetical protein